MKETNSAPFKALWIADCSVGALDRRFFGRLWEEILCTRPIVDTVVMLDDDVVMLGEPSAYTHLMIDIRRKGELRGYIQIWVDDLSAAAASLASRSVPFALSKACYDGLVIDRTYLGEPLLEVRLSQAPEDVMERYRSLQGTSALASPRPACPNPDRDLLDQAWVHQRYGNRWIAIENGKIIADGDSRCEIAEALKTMDTKDVLVSYVYPPTLPESITKPG